MNPCTSCLAVAFLAAVLYLISAVRGTYFQSSAGALVTAAGGQRNAVGPAAVADGGGPASQRRRWKNRTGSFIVGDDEVQLCKMTSSWAASAIDQQDYLHPSAGSGQTGSNACNVDHQLPTLFYVDAAGALVYNQTAAAGSRYDVMADSCTAWKIEWNLDSGYVEKKVLTLTKIDADFVHVSCRLRRHREVDSVDAEHRAASTTPRSRGPVERSERHRTSSSLLLVAERRARQMHRDQLRRRSPHFVGAAGLPDPFSHVDVAAAQHGNTSDAGDKHATPNERRSGPDEQLPDVSETHKVDEGKPTQHGKLDVPRLSRSERDLDHEDGSDRDTSAGSVYHQWIAQIHPLDEAVNDERADDGEKRQSDRLNVLVLALESVSSMSFDRYLPKSHGFLVDQPHAVFFTGYNVVGDAAPANVISLLTGIR